jgi:hypothetical protein
MEGTPIEEQKNLEQEARAMVPDQRVHKRSIKAHPLKITNTLPVYNHVIVFCYNYIPTYLVTYSSCFLSHFSVL